MPRMKPQTLRRRYERVAQELITTGRRDQAAANAGISTSTLDRWFKDEVFQEILREKQQQAMVRALAEVRSNLSEAGNALLRNLTCGQPSAEIRAATALFDLTLRLHESVDLTDRLAQLEVSVGSREH